MVVKYLCSDDCAQCFLRLQCARGLDMTRPDLAHTELDPMGVE